MIANPQLSSQRQRNSLSWKALKPFSEPVASRPQIFKKKKKDYETKSQLSLVGKCDRMS